MSTNVAYFHVSYPFNNNIQEPKSQTSPDKTQWRYPATHLVAWVSGVSGCTKSGPTVATSQNNIQDSQLMGLSTKSYTTCDDERICSSISSNHEAGRKNNSEGGPVGGEVIFAAMDFLVRCVGAEFERKAWGESVKLAIIHVERQHWHPIWMPHNWIGLEHPRTGFHWEEGPHHAAAPATRRSWLKPSWILPLWIPRCSTSNGGNTVGPFWSSRAVQALKRWWLLKEIQSWNTNYLAPHPFVAPLTAVQRGIAGVWI